MNARGFSLIETVVALSLTAVALSALAHLFIASAQANADARRATFASVLAAQKMEQLRSLGADLSPRPGGSLADNVEGLCDFLDERGRPLGSGVSPPTGTVYIRRWSIESLPSDPAETLLLQVMVVRRTWRGTPRGSGNNGPFAGARLVSVKTWRAG